MESYFNLAYIKCECSESRVEDAACEHVEVLKDTQKKSFLLSRE